MSDLVSPWGGLVILFVGILLVVGKIWLEDVGTRSGDTEKSGRTNFSRNHWISDDLFFDPVYRTAVRSNVYNDEKEWDPSDLAEDLFKE